MQNGSSKFYLVFQISIFMYKNICVCYFIVYIITSFSCHKQKCLMRRHLEGYPGETRLFMTKCVRMCDCRFSRFCPSLFNQTGSLVYMSVCFIIQFLLYDLFHAVSVFHCSFVQFFHYSDIFGDNGDLRLNFNPLTTTVPLI